MTHENIYYLLSLVYTCKYVIMYMFIESPYFSYYVAIQSGFRVSIWVSGIRGFGFGDGLSPESVFGAVSGFGFGFRVWVHRDSTRSESTPLLMVISPYFYDIKTVNKTTFLGANKLRHSDLGTNNLVPHVHIIICL